MNHAGHIIGGKINCFKTRNEKGNVMSIASFIKCFTCNKILVKKNRK